MTNAHQPTDRPMKTIPKLTHADARVLARSKAENVNLGRWDIDPTDPDGVFVNAESAFFESADGELYETVEEYVVVIDENFTDGGDDE